MRRVALLWALAAVGCSLVLNWDAAGLPCKNNACATGYTCLVNQCISDDSLADGETCNNDRQCEPGLVCAPSLFTCRKPCPADDFLSVSSACNSGQYCTPVLNEDSAYEGACVDSAGCDVDGDCDSGEACVKLGATASACLVRCEITFGSGGSYDDNCGSTALSRKYCQPVGLEDAERMICLDTTSSAEGAGSFCSPVTQPCQEGLACIGTVCRTHCAPSAQGSAPQCNGNQVCCSLNTSTDQYSVCKASCSEP